MKKATITEIKSVKPYTKGEHWTTYYYTMVLSNWDTINIGKKSNSAFQLNDEIKYVEVEPKDEYGVIKVRPPKPEEDTTPWPNPAPWAWWTTYKPQSNLASFALSYAKDICVAWKIEVWEIDLLADTFYDRLVKKWQ